MYMYVLHIAGEALQAAAGEGRGAGHMIPIWMQKTPPQSCGCPFYFLIEKYPKTTFFVEKGLTDIIMRCSVWNTVEGGINICNSGRFELYLVKVSAVVYAPGRMD